MRLLLDTHIILWAITDSDKLPDVARKLIIDESNEVFFSLASIWEVEIKHGLGKLPISGKEIYTDCLGSGFTPCKIEMDHIAALTSLTRNEGAPRHNDPFDRMLIVQAKVDNMKLLTHDSLIPDYNEDCILSV